MGYDKVPSLAVWLEDSKQLAFKGRVAVLAAAFNSPGGVTAPVPPNPRPHDLKPIDDLLALYEKAWSPMAKRNLVADLSRQITKWGQKNPGPLPNAMASLKEVVVRTQRTFTPGQKYTDAICLAWCVPCNYDPLTGHIDSKDSRKNTAYLFASPDDYTDMVRKCGKMIQAIREAKAGIASNGTADNDQTLKIFMAPEFYFRGRNGAYSPEIVSQIVPHLINSLGPGWDHWLFLFGTAVAAVEDIVTTCETCKSADSIRFDRPSPGSATTTARCVNDPGGGTPHRVVGTCKGAEVHNVALIAFQQDRHLVAKEYVSGIDYQANEVRVQPGTTAERMLQTLSPPGSRTSRIKSVFDDERMGGCILNMAGLTIGVEICLDHRLNSLGGLGRASPYSKTIQVLLIPSYGMSIGDGLYCRPGGIVFNVDGQYLGRSNLRINSPGVNVPHWSAAVSSGVGSIQCWGPCPIPY